MKEKVKEEVQVEETSMEETKKRTRRTPEQIAAFYDEKINYHKALIASLEEKKAQALSVKTRKKKNTIKNIVDAAKETGMTPEEIAEKLGITL